MKLIVVVVVMRAGEERKNLKSVSVWKNEAQLKISHSKKGHRIWQSKSLLLQKTSELNYFHIAFKNSVNFMPYRQLYFAMLSLSKYIKVLKLGIIF